MSRLPAVLSVAVLFFSLALVAISIASMYLTARGIQLAEDLIPAGYYTWYRGPEYIPDYKPKVELKYFPANEGLILAAGVAALLTGFTSTVGYFFTRDTTKPSATKSVLSFLLIPSSVATIATLIALISSTVISATHNDGKCRWENGYYGVVLTCTREQATCDIAKYFVDDHVAKLKLNSACGPAQTGRHLVAALFSASAVLLAVSGAKFFLSKKQPKDYVESADERVARLQRNDF